MEYFAGGFMTRFLRSVAPACFIALAAAQQAPAQGIKFEFKADSMTIGPGGIKVQGGTSKVTKIESTVVRIKKQLVAMKLWQGKIDESVDQKLRDAVAKYRQSVGFSPKTTMAFANNDTLLADMIAHREVLAKKWAMLKRDEVEPVPEQVPRLAIVTETFGPAGAKLSDDGLEWTKGKDSGPAHRRFHVKFAELSLRFDPGGEKVTGCCDIVAGFHDGVALVAHEVRVEDDACKVNRWIFRSEGVNLSYHGLNEFCGVPFAGGGTASARPGESEASFVALRAFGDFAGRFVFANKTLRFAEVAHDVKLAPLAAFAGKPPGKPGEAAGKTIFTPELVALIGAIAPAGAKILGDVRYAEVGAEDGALLLRGKSGLFDSVTLLIEPAGGKVAICHTDIHRNQIAGTTVQPPRDIAGAREKACPTDMAGLRALLANPPAPKKPDD